MAIQFGIQIHTRFKKFPFYISSLIFSLEIDIKKRHNIALIFKDFI